VFAEPATPGRAVSRCKECARQVYSDSTTAGTTAPSGTQPPPIPERTPKVELYDLEGITEEPPVVPLSKPQVAENLPEAKPVAPRAPITNLPAWATRRPNSPTTTVTALPPGSTSAASRPSEDRPMTAPIVIPSSPEAIRPEPKIAMALFVLGLLGLLALAAFLVVGYAIVQGLKAKNKRAELPSTTIVAEASKLNTRALQ